MLRVIVFFAVALSAVPSTVPAALMLHVDHVELVPSDVDRTVYLDVHLEDLDDTRQWITAFAVFVRGPANTGSGVQFLRPARLPSTDHPYLFGVGGAYPPFDFLSNFREMYVGGGGQIPGLEADVTPRRNGLYSIQVLVPAGSPPGHYPVHFDPEYVSFGGLTPSEVTLGPPGGVTIVPEPAGLLPLAAAPLALRRRRRGACRGRRN